MSQTRRQVARFLVVGGTTVGIDFVVYSALVNLAVQVDLAKAVGFVAGTAFAYAANRLWTFSAAGGPRRLLMFVALYLGTLGVNVVVNMLVLQLLGFGRIGYVLGFLVATGVSATLNFLGMKHLVFGDRNVKRFRRV